MQGRQSELEYQPPIDPQDMPQRIWPEYENDAHFKYYSEDEFMSTGNLQIWQPRHRELISVIDFLENVPKVIKMEELDDLCETTVTLHLCFVSMHQALLLLRERIGLRNEKMTWVRQYSRKIKNFTDEIRPFSPITHGVEEKCGIFEDLLLFLFDVPRDIDGKMVWRRVRDPGDLRHIFQTSKHFMGLLAEVAKGMRFRENDLLKIRHADLLNTYKQMDHKLTAYWSIHGLAPMHGATTSALCCSPSH